MAIIQKFVVVSVMTAIPAVGFGYTSAFTLDFETAANPAPGWSDTVFNNTLFVSGENVSVDNPPFSPTPETAPGYNGTKWLRIGPDVQPNGVVVAAYDGSAGGSATTAQDFEATVDIYVNPTVSTRYQVCLMGRWVSGASPFQLFNTSAFSTFAAGYGYRGGGATTTYGGFSGVNETGGRWVRLKMTVVGSVASVAIDRDLNGTYDLTEPNVPITSTDPGKIGIECVLNDGSAGNVTPNQYVYVDNLTYTPLASVSDWSVY